MAGKVVAELEPDADADAIEKTLLDANRAFSESEERKAYSSHVKDGRREGIYFENAIPYGEDRDGDGEIDHRGRRRQRGG